MSRSPARQIDIIDELVIEELVNEDLVDEKLDNNLASKDWLHTVMQRALEAALAEGEGGQVSLVLTDDATVRKLNRQYRGVDEVTDVLSFSAEFPGHWEGPEEPEGPARPDDPVSEVFPFILPPHQVPPLGEVIVSYPQARRQASEKGHDLKMELALLIVHGVLHLVGHDHLEAPETARMQAKERWALQSLFPLGAVSP